MAPVVLLLFLYTLQLTAAEAASKILPFILLHGISDECKTQASTRITSMLSNMSGATGHCIEMGNGISDSWLMPVRKQVELVCDQVNALPDLQGGYNIVALSQGNMVARGLIGWCNGPPVNNYISMAGPHAGMSSVPKCTILSFCQLADSIMALGVYTPFVQAHLTPSGYIKIPTDLGAYYKGSTFLPHISNELAEHRNATLKHRFTQLKKLVLVKFANDTVLVPQETAWFGFYPVNDTVQVVPMAKTALYMEDWIGLKQMNEAGKVTFLTFSGDHLDYTPDELRNQIAPFLVK